jgi:hypothetical protein
MSVELEQLRAEVLVLHTTVSTYAGPSLEY